MTVHSFRFRLADDWRTKYCLRRQQCLRPHLGTGRQPRCPGGKLAGWPRHRSTREAPTWRRWSGMSVRHGRERASAGTARSPEAGEKTTSPPLRAAGIRARQAGWSRPLHPASPRAGLFPGGAGEVCRAVFRWFPMRRNRQPAQMGRLLRAAPGGPFRSWALAKPAAAPRSGTVPAANGPPPRRQPSRRGEARGHAPRDCRTNPVPAEQAGHALAR